MKKGTVTIGKLIIRLNKNEDQPIYWATKVNHSNYNNKFGRLDNINKLSELTVFSNLNVVILVSSDCVIFRCISFIHKKNLKALPYLLEESIASDVEKLHIIILQQNEKDLSIAAIERNLLNKWLQSLNQAGISPDILMPDIMALPLFDNGWSAVKLDKQWLIRKDLISGFLINSSDFEKIIPHITRPNVINTFSIPVSNNIEWVCHPLVEPILLLAENIDFIKFNFLHGEFISEKLKKKYVKTIVRLFIMSVFIFTSIFLKIFIDGHSNNNISSNLNKKIFKYYYEINPKDLHAVDVKKSIKIYISSLKKITSGSLFMNYMVKLNFDLLKKSQVNITNINFSQKEENLTVHFSSPDKDILSKIDDKLGTDFEVKKNDSNDTYLIVSILNSEISHDK